MSSSIFVSISEHQILKAILEFLENRHFHITQLSLERETGVINGDFSEDVLFLRQLILDGQWDSAIDFLEPLKDFSEFDNRTFRYFITKYKYYELLCIKQEPGLMHDNDFAVEEIVECLKELEDLCSCSEDFRRLCSLLTLKRLSDYEDMKNWNPSSARVECFYKILPLVPESLNKSVSKIKKFNNNSVNDRLIQLVTKGLLYEASVDYCQNQAFQGENTIKAQEKFTNLLLQKSKLSSTDLSLISWLEVLNNEQFTVPFQQKSLDFKFENLKKPKLEAQWAEQILTKPFKPDGQFPYLLVPHSKLKCAEKISKSMIMPLNMFSSFAVEPHILSKKSVSRVQPMSQSTTAELGSFSINIKQLDDEFMMRQSSLITNMLKIIPGNTLNNISPSESSKIYVNPTLISSSFNASNEIESDSSNLEISHSRQELDAICCQNQSIPPSFLRNLSPVRELNTPSSIKQSFAGNTQSHSYENLMITSKLFQEFLNKNSNLILSTHQKSNLVNQNLFQMQTQNSKNKILFNQPNNYCLNINQQPVMCQNIYLPINQKNSFYNNKSMSNTLKSITLQTINTNFSKQLKSSKSFIDVNSATIDTVKEPIQNNNLSVQFVPLCRYEDSQAIRAVAFHPSGKFFAIGTNSKQIIICKYPDIRRTNLNYEKDHVLSNPEILLTRPKQHRGSVYCCGFNPSGELLATGSNDKTIRLMAFNSDECKIGAEMELTMHDGTVRELIFMENMSNYSSIVVSGGAGSCQICLTDCTTGQTFKSFTGHTSSILGLYSWNPGTCFASCSQDKTIRFWDLRASSAVNIIYPNLKTTNSPVTSVCVDPSGKLLVSGHEDASIMLYDIIGGRAVQTFRPHGDEVRTVRCSNAAYYLLSGSYDRRVVITDIRGNLNSTLMYLPVAEHGDKVVQCRWHPQDFTFLSTSADKTAILWSLPQLIS